MARFLNFNQYDPYEQIAVTLVRSRAAIERAYLAAVQASDLCNALLKESLYHQVSPDPSDSLSLFGIAEPSIAEQKRIDRLHLDAEIEDMQADWQASVVVLFADDTLQRFTRGVLHRKASLEHGYGPIYLGGVALTSLLQAGANAIRHVSEWDDDETLKFPYDPSLIKKGSDAERAWRNIEIFQRAFGIGKHERIREMQSWRIVCTVDSLYGTHRPDYARFEAAIVAAAIEIAVQAGNRAVSRLVRAFDSRQLTSAVPWPVPLHDLIAT